MARIASWTASGPPSRPARLPGVPIRQGGCG